MLQHCGGVLHLELEWVEMEHIGSTANVFIVTVSERLARDTGDKHGNYSTHVGKKVYQ